MDFKALKTVLFILLIYVGITFLSWWIFDFIYLTFNSIVKASVQIQFKERIFYVLSILTFLIFINKIYNSNSKKEYFFGIILLLFWVIYQTVC